MPVPPPLAAAIAAVPAGAWAVGVSGGADSVALLALLGERADVVPHVVHLDHETRGGESELDAAFVRDLAARRGVGCTSARRSEVETWVPALPANVSARFRALRLALFARVVRDRRLAGVLLAHHADDQAETVLLRLLRGSGPAGLAGMAPRATIGGLVVRRPLLEVRRDPLRAFLRGRSLAWREDASNASDAYARNRARRLLGARPELVPALLDLSAACRQWRGWLAGHAPVLPARFDGDSLATAPPPLARAGARRWLAARAGGADVPPAAVDRLIELATDAASPARQHFPGGVVVRRRKGIAAVEGDEGMERRT